MITAANPFLRFSKYSFFGRFGGTIKIQPASWDFSSMSKYSPTKKSKRMITQKKDDSHTCSDSESYLFPNNWVFPKP